MLKSFLICLKGLSEIGNHKTANTAWLLTRLSEMEYFMEVLVFAKENMISILGSMKRFSFTILTHIYGQYITALAV